jgi:tetratricopeptide (TPR) repeat protein
MKRAERHHLKENELQQLAIKVRGVYDERRRQLSGVVIGAIVVVAVAAGYFLWREHVQSRAHTLLADALSVQEARIAVAGTPPTPGSFPTERARLEAAVGKLKAAADAYPSTDAGIFARSQEAANYLSLGNTTAAIAAYQEVIRLAGDSIQGQMARLGLAEAQARSGQYDQAINAFKELAQRKDGPLPIDGILMELGRTYRDAGKRSDAQQTLNRLVDEYPDSPFTQEAKRELEGLNKAA